MEPFPPYKPIMLLNAPNSVMMLFLLMQVCSFIVNFSHRINLSHAVSCPVYSRVHIYIIFSLWILCSIPVWFRPPSFFNWHYILLLLFLINHDAFQDKITCSLNTPLILASKCLYLLFSPIQGSLPHIQFLK